MVEPRAVEVAVPAAVGELALLDRVDYEDAFQVDTPLQGTPEQWMRAFIEDAPRWFQLLWINLLGRGILRARIGPMTAPDHVLGWKVIVDRPDAFAVGLDGSNALVRLIALTPPGHAVLATQIRLDSTPVRMLWPAIRDGHRFFAPYLLNRAASQWAAVGNGTSGPP